MVTKQVTGIVVDKSIEDIDSIIHECTEKLSTNDIISNQSSAEYYAKELLKIGFLENVKQIFRTILNKPNFSTLDLSNIRMETEFSCFKINSLGKILKEREINIWGGSYPAIKIDFISENGNYIVK